MRIRELRQEKNISQKDLADAIGVTASVLSRYESGQIPVPQDRLMAIASALDVDYAVLLPDGYEAIIETKNSNPKSGNVSLLAYMKKLNGHYLAQLIKLSASGSCELCKNPAPFQDKEGRPYLEIYTIDENYQGNEPEKNMVALCPNCYKKMIVNPSKEDLKKIKEVAEKHII